MAHRFLQQKKAVRVRNPGAMEFVRLDCSGPSPFVLFDDFVRFDLFQLVKQCFFHFGVCNGTVKDKRYKHSLFPFGIPPIFSNNSPKLPDIMETSKISYKEKLLQKFFRYGK